MAEELRYWLVEESETTEGVTLNAVWEEMNFIYEEHTGMELPFKKKKWVGKHFQIADENADGHIMGAEVYPLIDGLNLNARSIQE